MKSKFLLIIPSILIIISCVSNNLPFIGEKFCSLQTGINFIFQISRNGNARIIVERIPDKFILYDGVFNQDSIVVKGEGTFIIRKDYAVYYQGEWRDTLRYFKSL
jgi:hypothetical protein